MKPDSSRSVPRGRALDAIERAHLVDPRDTSHTIHRYPASRELEPLVQRFWIPVWSVAEGREAPQRVLQYPVCLMVVSPGYARFYGVSSGVSTTTLTGTGWAVGVMFTPAAAYLLAGGPVRRFTDSHVDLGDVLGASATGLRDRIRDAMTPDPESTTAHKAAMVAYEEVLRAHLPIDEEGRLVNDIVRHVEEKPGVTRVAQLCAEFDLTERALQRLLDRRIGLHPKWLIQRRRLQEAAELLRRREGSLANVAAQLGYADQSHLTRDFCRVTGMTPGEFAARFG